MNYLDHFIFYLFFSIGIGTYLVRLSQRVVQVDNSSLILTGYTALNKLLGREVSIKINSQYTGSNFNPINFFGPNYYRFILQIPNLEVYRSCTIMELGN